MGNQQGKLQHPNQSGRPKKMVHWKSAERPSTPGRPILIPLSDQQPDVVNLRWERPKLDGGSPITGYTVEHRRMGSPHWVRATPTPVPRCEVSISGLEPGWRYQFRVFAENIVGRSDPSELSDPLTVTLQRNAISVPRFVDELQDMQAVEDERIEFRVRVLGQPQPEISWFKDGYEIFSSRRTKIVNDNDVSVLVIHQVALTDEGEIKCTATNRAGHVVTKAKLMVQAPPKIRLPRTYEDGLIVEADEVLRLKVGIAGQPPPTIAWLHEGEVVANGGRFEIVNTDRNSLLKIDNVQRDDRGEYTIRASNKLGEDVTAFLVTVTARPNPPGKVLLNMSFGKSAVLSWTAPADDGGCKIGNYIVEYFRVGWNVWLKAATTRQLNTTLHDLIEGSEYKFRVKAENPYGLSDPSEESDVLFIPDPKRGITKPKSETKLAEDRNKPLPPRRKTMSPSRPQQDAGTDAPMRMSPAAVRKPKPQLIDNEDLHRAMSYGTPDQVLKMDVRKSPSLSSADSAAQTARAEQATPAPKSPQLPPANRNATRPKFLGQFPATKDKSPIPSPLAEKPAQQLAAPERTTSSDPFSGNPTRSLSPMDTAAVVRKSSASPQRRSPSPPHQGKLTAALQRSAEPVQLGVNQNVRRYSGHSLSPAKHAPALAIAIATSMATANNANGNGNGNGTRNGNGNGNGNFKPNEPPLANPTIEISEPPQPQSGPLPASPETTPLSTPPVAAPLSSIDKHDEVYTSNEFMLLVIDKSNSKAKDKDKHDSFELDLEDALQPPPISISAPDLVFTNLRTFPLRRCVSSTELLFQREFARFYEAVALEEAEKARKLERAQEKSSTSQGRNMTSSTTNTTNTTNTNTTTIRKRLGSMSEAERLSFERRNSLRRQSADVLQDVMMARKWSSRENISSFKPLSRTTGTLSHNQRQESQESEELSDYQVRGRTAKTDSYDMCSDYTESTASSENDSIEKFKQELMAHTRSPSPRELETYHPRDMSSGIFTPYRAPTSEHAAVVLNRPMPLPSPDFVPKPILKRSSNENVVQNGSSDNGNPNHSPNPNSGNEKLDLTKGIKSFFKRDKRSATEKNTEENENISKPPDPKNPDNIAAQLEIKRKLKEEEERKRQEAERIMREEAHAAVDHYSDLVRQVSSTRSYHTPLYLDHDELKKVAERAVREDTADDGGSSVAEQLQLRRQHSPDRGLMPPQMSNKPRLSISERGQMMHVRETASDLAVSEKPKPQIPDTPSEDTSEPPTTTTSTVISETTVERPDSRGRTRIVKVKRIIKKRVPSSTRSRDASTSRPPSSPPSNQNLDLQSPIDRYMSEQRQRQRTEANASKSPGPLPRKPLPTSTLLAEIKDNAAGHEIAELKTPEQLSEEAHEKVRSALSYSTDLVLFIVACYVYLFKDARLVLPILALMIYRQLGEALSGYMPNWLKRKKDDSD